MAEFDTAATRVRVQQGVAAVVEARSSILGAVPPLRFDLRPGDQRPS